MIEREVSTGLQFQLVQEAELIHIVQSGEKLLNAYIYALAEESADIDGELFNIERLQKPNFDLFAPTLSFEHDSALTHQNYTTRKSVLDKKPAMIASSAATTVAKKEPVIKSEIKKNEPVKPPVSAAPAQKTAAADGKKQQTLFGAPK